MTEEIPIRIIITPEEESATIPVIAEPVLVPERTRASGADGTRQVAQKAGQGLTRAARRVWHSSARRKVTQRMRKGVTAAAAKGSEVANRRIRQAGERQVQERVTAVQTHIRETDWQAEAKTTAAKGLRWLSTGLNRLAARLTPQKNPPTDRGE